MGDGLLVSLLCGPKRVDVRELGRVRFVGNLLGNNAAQLFRVNPLCFGVGLRCFRFRYSLGFGCFGRDFLHVLIAALFKASHVILGFLGKLAELCFFVRCKANGRFDGRFVRFVAFRCLFAFGFLGLVGKVLVGKFVIDVGVQFPFVGRFLFLYRFGCKNISQGRRRAVNRMGNRHVNSSRAFARVGHLSSSCNAL